MGPDTVGPPEGAGEPRKAKSSWSASHRNKAYTPPADLKDQRRESWRMMHLHTNYSPPPPLLLSTSVYLCQRDFCFLRLSLCGKIRTRCGLFITRETPYLLCSKMKPGPMEQEHRNSVLSFHSTGGIRRWSIPCVRATIGAVTLTRGVSRFPI